MDSFEPRYRSIFWPVLLIGVGIIWLLSNFGLLPPVSLAWLLNLWPLILIVVGLDLLFGRRSPIAGGLIALLVIGAILFALTAGPALGLTFPDSPEVKVERFTAPLDQASSATIRIDSSSEPVKISRTSSNLLFDGEIGHTGVIDFQTSGSTDKTVSITKRDTPGSWAVGLTDPQRLGWRIGLSDKIPLRLEMNSSSGSIDMNLAGLQLSSVRLDSGSGSVQMNLPSSDRPYEVNVESGSGAIHIQVPAVTDLTLRTNSGSGSLNISLPSGAAVRIEAQNHGSGSLHLPDGLNQVSSGDDKKEGVWESQGYAAAGHRILIQLQDVGSGSVNIETRP